MPKGLSHSKDKEAGTYLFRYGNGQEELGWATRTEKGVTFTPNQESWMQLSELAGRTMKELKEEIQIAIDQARQREIKQIETMRAARARGENPGTYCAEEIVNSRPLWYDQMEETA